VERSGALDPRCARRTQEATGGRRAGPRSAPADLAPHRGYRGAVGSIYEMSSVERLEAAKVALAREGIVSSRTKGTFESGGPFLGVRHNDTQTEHVRRIVSAADKAAVKR
jgi:hypothetical protein